MISNQLSNLRTLFKDKTIVLCHGCFDVFHYGHLTYLKKSKDLGDILVVSITHDHFIKKGVDRPISNINQRLEIINELKCVDYCCVSEDYTAVDIIRDLKPSIYSKGMDAKGKESNPSENLFCENQELIKVGGKLVFIEYVPNISSTSIISKCIFSVI
jgi:rfaE bifunctional protein nucleotidyltransferase chain/domain